MSKCVCIIFYTKRIKSNVLSKKREKKEGNISNRKLKKIIQNINYCARHERLKWDWNRNDANC